MALGQCYFALLVTLGASERVFIMETTVWLTVREAARILRVTEATVRRWVLQGRLEAMRPGQRKILIDGRPFGVEPFGVEPLIARASGD